MTLAVWTGQVRDLVFGVDQDVPLERAPAGLGLPGPNKSDRPLLGHGTVGGFDWLPFRPIEIPLVISEDSGSLAEDQLDAVKEAWVYSDDDTTLDLRFANSERRYYGRTRGLDCDLADVHQGVITGLVGHFDALDPWGYGASTTSTSATPVTFSNPGNVSNPSRSRVTLTATASTSSGTITNTDDTDGLTMTFAGIEGTTIVIDLFAHTITEDGTRNDGLLQSGSGWPVIVPGTNRFAFTGFTALSVAWRPAYL